MIALSLSPRQEAQWRRQTWFDELQFLSKSSLTSTLSDIRGSVCLTQANNIKPSAATNHNILLDCEILTDDDEDMISWCGSLFDITYVIWRHYSDTAIMMFCV